MKTLSGDDIGEPDPEPQGHTFEEAASILYPEDPSPQDADDKTPSDSEQGAPAPNQISVGDFSITVPEGAVVNEAILGDFEKVSRANNLTREQVQELANLHVKALKEVTAEHDGYVEKRVQEVLGWRAELKRDPNLKSTIQDARWAMSQLLAGNELEQFKHELDRTGLGEFPPLVRALSRLAPKLRSRGAGAGNEPEIDGALVLYGPEGVRPRK